MNLTRNLQGGKVSLYTDIGRMKLTERDRNTESFNRLTLAPESTKALTLCDPKLTMTEKE